MEGERRGNALHSGGIMAWTARNAKLDTRNARLKLDRQEWHQSTIEQGLALRYRRASSGYGVWFARIKWPDGTRTDARIGMADDFSEADGAAVFNWKQAQAEARRLAERGPVARYTVGDAIDAYMEWFRHERKSADATAATIAAHIRPHFGDRPVADLSAEEIKTWRDKLARGRARARTAKGKAQRFKAETEDAETREEAKRARRATANRVLAALRAILNKAFEDGKAPDDSEWRRVAPFANVDKPRVRFLTAAEAGRLVNSCTPDFRPLVRAALLTGARYGELVRLNVGDFNAATGQVYIAPSKSGKPRYVPLNAAGVELFKSLAVGRKPDAPMFAKPGSAPTTEGEAKPAPARWGKNHQQKPLTLACKRAKISPPVRFHELRHSYASALAQAGADLLTISKLLGHADTRITARHYAHLCDRTLANAVNQLLPAFGATEPDNVRAIA